MKPIPGKPYTIVDENTLSLVSQRAYGDATFWRRIWNANQTGLRSGNPDLIYPGEVIMIPELPERRLPETSDPNKDPDGIYVDLDGYEFRPLSARILRTMDTVANSFQLSIPWQPGEDLELDKRIRPKSFTNTKISIGGERILTGTLYLSEPAIGNGTILNLFGETSTVDLVDSTLKPPLEFANISLEDLIVKIAQPHGFRLINDVEDTGGLFDMATATRGEKAAAFLIRLARQRGTLLSNNVYSDLVLLRAKLDGAPIETFEEGKSPGVTGWRSSVNGRNLFREYRATGDSSVGTEEAISTDKNVPKSRFTEIRANESTSGNMQVAADWARNKQIGDALTFPLNVEGYRDPQGNLYKENEIATVLSPSMFIEPAFNFLLKSVEYNLNQNGRSTILNFTPPTVYTQGEVIEPDSWNP